MLGGALTGARGSAGLCHHTLPTARGSGLSPSRPRCPSPRPQAGTMAQVGHRVDYLAGFCCPVGGLVAGKPRVLCHENEIYLSNGTEFVYVYDQEGKVLKVRGLEGWGVPPCVPHPCGTVGTLPSHVPAPYPWIPSVRIQQTNPTGSTLCFGVWGCCQLAPLPALWDTHWLRLHRLVPPSAGASPPSPPRPSGCPRCHSTLTDTLLPLLICSDYHF